jgi:hypothetical protein
MTRDTSTSSIAATEQPELDMPAQYTSDEVSTPCFAVSHGIPTRGEQPMSGEQFSRIFRMHRASNRHSIMASHDHPDVKANDSFCIGRIGFLLDVYSQKVVANFNVLMHDRLLVDRGISL